MQSFPKPKKRIKCGRCGERHEVLHTLGRGAVVQAKFRKKGNKYGATRVERANYTFGSKLEAAVFDFLKLRERAGELSNIKCQVPVKLTRAKILYIADFSAIEVASNEMIFIEAKGMNTATWAIKLRLWHCYGPGKLEIWRGNYNSPFLAETVIPREFT